MTWGEARFLARMLWAPALCILLLSIAILIIGATIGGLFAFNIWDVMTGGRVIP